MNKGKDGCLGLGREGRGVSGRHPHGSAGDVQVGRGQVESPGREQDGRTRLSGRGCGFQQRGGLGGELGQAGAGV